jgi:phospholipid/cholesterol/gamma-HCH transport system substrate-binding protein
MERVAQRLDRGEGTMGKALQDSLLYDEMLETVRNTNRLVKDIQKNPKRYIKVSVF